MIAPESQATIKAVISDLMTLIHGMAVSKGWWGVASLDEDTGKINPLTAERRNFGEQIALMHSELSEVLEAYRLHGLIPEFFLTYQDKHGHDYPIQSYNNVGGEPGDDMVPVRKPEGIASEFADTIIRIMDTCQAYNIPLAEALLAKIEYNATRPHRHGGKTC